MVAPFPGGVGLSGLSVYDWPTADGLCGGSPHVHLACAEAYVVVEGEGHVQTLTHSGYAETPLRPGTVAWFTPGTIHRLVNEDGRLRIVVVMQNDGLPEAGDAVFTFPPEVLADPESYAAAASLSDEQSARGRRDLALEGFHRLRKQVEAGEGTALDAFYEAAVALKADRLEAWEERWRSVVLAAARLTGDHLARLRAGSWTHLRAADVRHLTRPAEQRLGMCGRLDTYDRESGTA